MISSASEQRPLKVFAFTRQLNFGDRLNDFILPTLLNRKIEKVGLFDSDLVGIGSLMQDFSKSSFVIWRNRLLKSEWRRRKTLHIWGTGFIRTELNWRLFIRPVCIHALRGKLSLRRCEVMLGRKLHVALGDPGLLAKSILHGEKVEKRYDVGIIPHLHDQRSPLLQRIDIAPFSSVTIDVSAEPLHIIRTIASCRTVIASAMHGLIVADSLRVPNRWMLLDAHRQEDELFKFHDYYSVFDSNPPVPLDVRKQKITVADIEAIGREYTLSEDQIIHIQENLKDSFPSLAG